MKRQQRSCLLLILFMAYAARLYPQPRRLSATIDPLHDFRTPISLSEMLTYKLSSVMHLLPAQGDQENTLETVVRELADAIALCDEKMDTLKTHSLYRDDRQHLQDMIDRIDALIHALETKKGVENRQNELAAQSLELLRTLKERLN